MPLSSLLSPRGAARWPRRGITLRRRHALARGAARWPRRGITLRRRHALARGAARWPRGIPFPCSVLSFSSGTGLLPPDRAEHAAVIVAVVADAALVAERLRLADPASVQNQRVRRQRPLLRRDCRTELLFDNLGII